MSEDIFLFTVRPQVAVCLGDVEFNNCRAVLLMIDEKLKKEPHNKALQALRAKQLEKFESHPLYGQAVALGIEAMALCQEAERKADDEQIKATILPYMILPSGINKSSEHRKESEEIEETLINPLRELLCCTHKPSGLKRTAEGIKGFAESFYDTGKLLLVDIPILLDKLGMKGVESLVKWEDKLGVQEGWVNLGEACKVLFDQTKQEWEDPEAYNSRMQAAREVEKKHELFRRAFNAENYHLEQDKWLGYIPAEVVQFFFGGQIIKGATKGATKGVQFIKRVQQGTKVAEGVKIVKGATQGIKAAGVAKLMEEGMLVGEMGKGIQIGEEAIKIGEYKITKTVAENIATRPYINSPSTIIDIMKSGKGVPDAYFKGGVNYKVSGSFQGSEGIFELGINPETNTIYHFVFKTAK
mgnify:CR=1 FL=1